MRIKGYISATAVAAALISGPAFAQEASDEDTAGIIVTGTRDARRTRFDALAPVDVLSSNALDAGVLPPRLE